MTPQDQYPSTSDCAPICGAQDDPVYLCLINARERLTTSHTLSAYATEQGQVCAIGAVFVASGIDVDVIGSYYERALHGAKMVEAMELDDILKVEALVAINLLNQAALARHPEAKDYGDWSGPLEWVNQNWKRDDTGIFFVNEDGWPLRDKWGNPAEEGEALVKAEILAIYDDAINQRAGVAA